MLTVATANVNGIRAAARRGMGAWFAGRDPQVDVLCLQEVRADDDTLRAVLEEVGCGEAKGWGVVHAEPADEGTKGRAGVAVVSRLPLTATRVGFGSGDARFDAAGRWVEADLRTEDGTDVTVVSAYVHSGEAGTAKQDDKMAFLAGMTERMTALLAAEATEGTRAVVTGDLNVGHRELDIKNWKGNRTKAGFLPEERAVLDHLLGELGWVDVARAAAGEAPGPYSWWSWRGKAFDNDSGWRIDYHLASPALAASARACVVDRAPTYAERWSDHAPVVATYEV